MDTMPLLTHWDPSVWAAAISEHKIQQQALGKEKSGGWGKIDMRENIWVLILVEDRIYVKASRKIKCNFG